MPVARKPVEPDAHEFDITDIPSALEAELAEADQPSPKKEPPAAVAASEPPAMPALSFSGQTLAAAFAAGFSPEEIIEFPTERALVIALNRLYANRQAAQSAPTAVGQAQPEAKEAGFDRSYFEEAGFDPKIIDTLEAVHKTAHQQGQVLQVIQDQLGAFRQTEAARQSQVLTAHVDSIIDRLEDYHSILGAHAGNDPAWVQSDEFKARCEIWNEVVRMAHGYRAVGQHEPPLNVLIGRAARALYGDQIDARKQATRDVSDQLRNQAGQFSAKPTQRQRPPLSREAAALKAMRDTAAANGWLGSPEEDLRKDFPTFE